MTEPINVTYSLETVLTRLEGKIDKLESRFDRLDEKVDALTVDMATVKTKLTTIERDVSDNKTALTSLAHEVADLKTTEIGKIKEEVANLKGFNAFVIPVIVAVITAALTTLGRFIPSP